MKDVSFLQFFRQRRMELRRDLRQKIEIEAQKLPSLARLQTLLDSEIAKLNPAQLARGRPLAALLVHMVIHLFGAEISVNTERTGVYSYFP